MHVRRAYTAVVMFSRAAQPKFKDRVLQIQTILNVLLFPVCTWHNAAACLL